MLDINEEVVMQIYLSEFNNRLTFLFRSYILGFYYGNTYVSLIKMCYISGPKGKKGKQGIQGIQGPPGMSV